MMPAPARLYLDRDAADLARICYGLSLATLCTRKHHAARLWVADILITRGWPIAAVAATLGYVDATTIRYHLRRARKGIAS